MTEHAALIQKAGRFLQSADLLLFPKEMSRELNRAFETRQRSDYEYAAGISNEDAKLISETANDFVAVIAKWLETA